MNLNNHTQRTTHVYDAQGVHIAIKHPDGSESGVVNGEDGKSYTVNNPDGSVEHHSRDDEGSTTRTVFADGTEETKKVPFTGFPPLRTDRGAEGAL